MPEATVNEDREAVFGEDQIRFTGQILSMQPKA